MSNTSPLISWLDHLTVLLPPKTISLVGAGRGTSVWVQWLAAHSQAAITLVEANPREFSALQRQQAAGNLTQASLLNTVIAPSTGEAEFFTVSLVAESGLLPLESMRYLWPNLHTVVTQIKPTMALSDLLQAVAQEGQQWLLLDCLPAAALLCSARAVLPKLDVVLARVLLTEREGQPAQWPEGTTLAEVAKALPDFTQLALQSSRHPSIAHALFVRDYRSASQRASQAQRVETRAKKIAQQAQAELKADLEKVHAERSELIKEQERQAQFVQTLQTDLSRATEDKNTESKAKLVAEKTKAELEAKYKKLQAEQQEISYRQQILEEEFSKAEAQLALFKELLLRDEINSESKKVDE